MNFEFALMELEEKAQKEGVALDDMISAYELRRMALQEQANAVDSDEIDEAAEEAKG